MTATIDPLLLNELAPHGVLRAAINTGNRLLARQDPETGALSGASLALAQAIASQLGVGLQPVVFNSAGAVVDALADRAWDIAFLAHQPERGEVLAFSEPYFTIEGTYLLAKDAPMQAVADIDTPGRRIASVKNAAYDLHLGRTLQHAQRLHAQGTGGALPLFRTENLDALAGLRPVLEKTAQEDSGLRVLPDSFMTIAQCIATPKTNTRAAGFIDQFVRDAIASGLVARAFDA